MELLRYGKDDIDIANRDVILSFLDGLTNAYRRKDIGYINTLYADQALFIVGRLIQDSGEQSPYEPQVEYLTFNRKEFVNRLTEVFQNNAWIDVKFNEVGILRHPRLPDVYGVSMTQHFTSSLYSDTGYLFLLVDFRDRSRPIIHVRTWQSILITPEDQKFSLGDMEIF